MFAQRKFTVCPYPSPILSPINGTDYDKKQISNKKQQLALKKEIIVGIHLLPLPVPFQHQTLWE